MLVSPQEWHPSWQKLGVDLLLVVILHVACLIHCGPKIRANKLCAITFENINRFR